jgi:F-type H+-transporting ATPase subunit c
MLQETTEAVKEVVANDGFGVMGKGLGRGIAAGLSVLGGGLGIGRLAASAMEGIARQPEASGDIRVSMIIAAALIEGFTFFGIVVAIMM